MLNEIDFHCDICNHEWFADAGEVETNDAGLRRCECPSCGYMAAGPDVGLESLCFDDDEDDDEDDGDRERVST